MELLAQTCRALYDEEFLNNQKLFKDNYSHNKILYGSLYEYNTYRNTFIDELPDLIKYNNIDDWQHSGWTSAPKTALGLKYSNDCESVLHNALLKLTKNQNKQWVDNMSYLLGGAIRGLAKTGNTMNDIEAEPCEECGNDATFVDIKDIYRHRHITNKMIVGMVNNMLFDIEMIEAGTDDQGALSRIIQFKCNRCNKFTDMLYDVGGGEMCIACD